MPLLLKNALKEAMFAITQKNFLRNDILEK